MSVISARVRVRWRHEAEQLLAKTVESYQETAQRLATWMEEAMPEGLAVFSLPEHQRRRLRTSNVAGRINKEFKQRTRAATLFPNKEALLRLTSAVLVEVSEEWETGKIYLRRDQS